MGILQRLRARFSRSTPDGQDSNNTKPGKNDKHPPSDNNSVGNGATVPLQQKNLTENIETGAVEKKSVGAGSGGSGARVQWSSPTEFLLTCIGFSVGLGNVWRFPYLCYKNGGGAFLIPYTLMIITIGIPLLFMEYSSGQYFGIGSLSLFKTVCPMFKGLGVCYCVLNCLVCIYYNVIIALSFYYIFSSFTTTLPWSHCNNTYNTPNCGDKSGPSVLLNSTVLNSTNDLMNDQNMMTSYDNDHHHNSTSPSEEFFRLKLMGEGDEQSIGNIGAVQWKLCLCLLLAWILVAAFVCKGIKSSGKVSYLTTTFPYLMLTVLVIRGVTLEGAVDGILYFIVPQWKRLLDADAAIQMFYALNLAWGGMITMSSYNQLNHNCYRDAIVINLVSFGTSLYAGVAVFAIIGFMANEQGLRIEEVIKSGPGLAFVAYPRALSLMPIPQLFTVAFFFMLFLLGVGSQMVCVETIITGIMDTWHFLVRKWHYRVAVISLVSSILFFLGIPCTTQGGMYVLQLMDHYAAGFSVLIIAVCECFCINWAYGHEKFKKHIHEMLNATLNRYWSFCWKFFSPILIVIIMVFSFVKYKPVEYGSKPYPGWAEFLGWCMVLASCLPIPIMGLYVYIKAKGSNARQKLQQAITPKTPYSTAGEEEEEQTAPLTPEGVVIVEEEQRDLKPEKLSIKPINREGEEFRKLKLSPLDLRTSPTLINYKRTFDRTVNLSDDDV